MQSAMLKSFKNRMVNGDSVDFSAPIEDFENFLDMHFGNEEMENKLFAATRG